MKKRMGIRAFRKGGEGNISPLRFHKAVEAVKRLVEYHGCTMMKMATEDEALTQEELGRRVDYFRTILPIEIKIGGPGARGDMVFAQKIGIHHLIVPMVESPYALSDFLAGVKEVFGDRRINLGVNIETKLAARSVTMILGQDSSRALSQITVGRGDLSKSMGLSPDDASVMRLAKGVVASARGLGYATSIGGGIGPGNVQNIASKLQPDFINTRNFAFAAGVDQSGVRKALEAEILICRAAGTRIARARISSLEGRLAG